MWRALLGRFFGGTDGEGLGAMAVRRPCFSCHLWVSLKSRMLDFPAGCWSNLASQVLHARTYHSPCFALFQKPRTASKQDPFH